MKPLEGVKFAAGWGAAILLQCLQLFPNFEPILGSTLPFARKMGPWAGAVFAGAALVAFDFISGKVGLWMVYTGLAYAVVGYAAGTFFRARELKLKNRLGFAAAATLFFDAVTAVFFGLQFGQPLAVTLAGQVPFTIYHLLGNLAAATLLTPAMNAAFVENKALDAAFSRMGSWTRR